MRQDWPEHDDHPFPWRQQQRAGSKADRMLTEILVTMPPLIAALDFELDREIELLVETAAREIIRADSSTLPRLTRVVSLAEAISSSRIEGVRPTVLALSRALGGITTDADAQSVVAARDALDLLLALTTERGVIALDDVLAAHLVLMRDDATDGRYAGQLRTVQNWIGGSDYSPIGAVHIPPPPTSVPELMADLLVYANRDDIPVIVQAAVVHAQFESIHPFTDGNGRIGRALINAVLRRRQLTTTTVVPIASAMVADQTGYFGLVNRYRDGYLGDFVANLAASAIIAAQESRVSADNLLALPAEWATQTSFRANSAGSILLDALLNHPVLTIDSAIAITGKTDAPVYAAMSRLVDDGIVHEVTGRKRDKIWAATEVVAELDELNSRILVRARAGAPA